MTSTPGLDYILRTNYRPNERRLELSLGALIKAHQVVNLINGKESIQIEDDFVVMNAVGRGARAYGWPIRCRLLQKKLIVCSDVRGKSIVSSNGSFNLCPLSERVRRG